MKKIIVLVVIVLVAAVFWMVVDKKIGVDGSFALKDGQSMTFENGTTTMSVSFEVKEFPKSDTDLREDFVYLITLSPLDSDRGSLEFNFRAAGKDAFDWQGSRYELEFLGIEKARARGKIIKI